MARIHALDVLNEWHLFGLLDRHSIYSTGHNNVQVETGIEYAYNETGLEVLSRLGA